MTNFLFDSLVKVQNHPYTNKNTTIIWSSAVKNLSEWLTTIVMLLQHLDPKLLSAQQLKQESPSMTHVKKCIQKNKYPPCHNTSSIVNFSEERSGKKRWQLAYFLSNWFEFWHTKETSKTIIRTGCYSSLLHQKVNFIQIINFWLLTTIKISYFYST